MKIFKKIVRKRYGRKKVYQYERLVLMIPKRYEDLARDLVGRKLKASVERSGNELLIRLEA